MTTLVSQIVATQTPAASRRANALAERLERGARALEDVASTLTTTEWHTRVPKDGRTIGVIVHHVASMYPLELQLAQALAQGMPIIDVTWEIVADLNARHAQANASVTKEEALDLLRRNSRAAAAAVRKFSNDELDGAAAVSLNAGAPLTCQFILEDHAVRHSYHHLERIQATLASNARSNEPV